MAGKYYKTRAASPYFPDGKTRFNLRDTPGVYIIYEDGEAVYIGSGINCYKSFYRHFQKWNERQQYRVKFSKTDTSITARIIYTNTKEKAAKLETALVLKYRPRKNGNVYIDFEADKDEKRTAAEVEALPTRPIITAETSEDLPF